MTLEYQPQNRLEDRFEDRFEDQTFEFNQSNTFCISLESKPKRWEKMEARFQQTKLNVTRWAASRGNTEDITDHFCGYLNAGQKGCAQSHIRIWRHIISENLPYGLVLEDDACFDQNWRTKLEQFHADIKDPDWEAIFLNASEPIHVLNKWVQVEEQFLTGGYILSRRGAEHLLNMFKDEFASSDWMTSRLQQHWHCYSYFPWLIIQEGDESTIGSGVEADHAKVVRCLSEIHYPIETYLL